MSLVAESLIRRTTTYIERMYQSPEKPASTIHEIEGAGQLTKSFAPVQTNTIIAETGRIEDRS